MSKESTNQVALKRAVDGWDHGNVSGLEWAYEGYPKPVGSRWDGTPSVIMEEHIYVRVKWARLRQIGWYRRSRLSFCPCVGQKLFLFYFWR